MGDGVLELGGGRARAAVEDEESRLVVLGVELLFQVGLVLAEPGYGTLATGFLEPPPRSGVK